MERTDLDVIDQTARDAALAAAGDTFWPADPDRRFAPGRYSNAELERISEAMGTGQDALPGADQWVVAGPRGKLVSVSPAHASDQSLRAAIRRREWAPREPGQGVAEGQALELRLLRKLRRLDGGATTYEASIRRLALLGRLSKTERCSTCEGTGFDLAFLNIGEVPCAACIGTGQAPIMSRKRKLAGFYDERRFYHDESGQLCDRKAERDLKIMTRAFTAKPGRKDVGGKCAQRRHTWNEDTTRKWCVKCGREKLKK